MLSQTVDSDITFLLILGLIALVVFIFLLVVAIAIHRAERKAKNETSSLARKKAPPLPQEHPNNGLASSQIGLSLRAFRRIPLMQELDEPDRAFLLKAFAFLFGFVLVFLAILPGVLQFHENIYQRLRQRGWTTYLQEFGEEGLNTSCTYFQGARKGDLLLDASGKLWAVGGCSRLAGLHIFDGREWISEKGNYFELADGSAGQIWAVPNGGKSLKIFDGQGWETYNLRELGLKDHPITRVEVDQDGRIWIITREERGPSVVEHINEFMLSPEGFPFLNNSISIDGYLNSFDGDPQSRIWAAVDRSFPKPEVTGVSLFDGTSLQHIADNGKNLKHVAGTALDGKDHLWVVTRCGSVLTYDGLAWTTILDQESFSKCDPFDMQGMILDDQDRIWAWNLRGAQVLNGNEWTLLTSENSGIAGEWVFDVVIDEADRVWIGSSGGVSLAALPDVQPLPQIVVSWHRTVSYIKTWLVGMAWFLPAIVAILWLATYFNLLPGVLVAVMLGLLCIGIGVGVIGPGNNSADRLLVYAGVAGTFLGILGGLLGGWIDKRQTRTGRRRLAQELAVGGVLLGAVFTYFFIWFRAMAGG